jgi:hypothetical protein
MSEQRQRDMVEQAQWEIKTFDQVSRTTSQKLLAEVIRLRDLMEDQRQEENLRDI